MLPPGPTRQRVAVQPLAGGSRRSIERRIHEVPRAPPLHVLAGIGIPLPDRLAFERLAVERFGIEREIQHRVLRRHHQRVVHLALGIALLQLVDDGAGAIDFDQAVPFVHEHEVAVLPAVGGERVILGAVMPRDAARRVDQRVALVALLGKQMHERVLRRQRSGRGDCDRLEIRGQRNRLTRAERRERAHHHAAKQYSSHETSITAQRRAQA